MQFTEYLKTENYISGLNQALTSVGYPEIDQVVTSILQSVAQKKYPINKLGQLIASEINAEEERAQEISMAIQNITLKDYKEELQGYADELYEKANELNDNFNLRELADKIFISAGYIYDEKIKQRIYFITAKYLLSQIDDKELTDYLLKSSKVGGLGLDEYQAIKVSEELKQILNTIRLYKLSPTISPEILRGLNGLGFSIKDIFDKTLDALEKIKEIDAKDEQEKKLIKKKEVFQATPPDLSSLLDQISKDIENNI